MATTESGLTADESQQEDLLMVNVKKVYKVMRENHLLLERKPFLKSSVVTIAELRLLKVTSGVVLMASSSTALKAISACHIQA